MRVEVLRVRREIRDISAAALCGIRSVSRFGQQRAGSIGLGLLTRSLITAAASDEERRRKATRRQCERTTTRHGLGENPLPITYGHKVSNGSNPAEVGTILTPNGGRLPKSRLDLAQ